MACVQLAATVVLLRATELPLRTVAAITITGLACAALAGVSAYRAGCSAARRLRAVIELMQRVEEGDYRVRLDTWARPTTGACSCTAPTVS